MGACESPRPQPKVRPNAPLLLARALPAWLQALPLALVFLVFFVVPLALTVMVSFWDYTEYSLVPAFTLRSYREMFEGCYDRLPDLCVTLKTYLSTLKFCLIVWLVTLVTGFFIAYFLAFHVRSLTCRSRCSWSAPCR